jgi:cyclohexyl-isocyanide hydratase
VQLTMEYDPQPPFDAGTPDRPEADQEQVARMYAAARSSREHLVRDAAARLTA